MLNGAPREFPESKGVVCECDGFRKTIIKVQSGVSESKTWSLKMTSWLACFKMTMGPPSIMTF